MKIAPIRSNQNFKAIYKFTVDYNKDEDVDKVAILSNAIEEGIFTPLSKETSLVYENPYAPSVAQDFAYYYREKNCDANWAKNHAKGLGIELPEYLYTKKATQYLLTEEDAKDLKKTILKNPMTLFKTGLVSKRIIKKAGDDKDTAYLRSLGKINQYGQELFDKFIKGREIIDVELNDLVQIENIEDTPDGKIEATIEIVKPLDKDGSAEISGFSQEL